jgi:hypothetical protein
MPKKEKSAYDYFIEGFKPTVERVQGETDDRVERKVNRRLVELDEEEERRKAAIRKSRGE